MAILRHILLATAFTSPSHAIDLTTIALLAHGDVSQKFQQTYSWDKTTIFTDIIYGNQKVGYWRRSISAQTRSIEIIPPSYKSVIEFYGQPKAGNRIPIGTHTFRPPDLTLFRSYLKLQTFGHRWRTPLLLTTAALPVEFASHVTNKNSHYVVVLNRLGEIVWLHVPTQGRRAFHSGLTTLKIGNQIALLSTEQGGTFELVGFNGAIDKTIDTRTSLVSVVFAGDFHYQAGHLQFLSQKTSFVRNPKQPWRRPKELIFSTTATLNEQRLVPEITHSSFWLFNPYSNAPMAKDVKHMLRYTSSQWTKNGTLLAEPHTNQALMLKPGGHAVAWSFNLQNLPNLPAKTRISCARLHTISNQLLIFASSKQSTELIIVGKDRKQIVQRVSIPNHSQLRRSSGCLEAGLNSQTSYAIINQDRRGNGQIVQVNAAPSPRQWFFSGFGRTSRLSPIATFDQGKFIGYDLP